jgi:hypothetical protein
MSASGDCRRHRHKSPTPLRLTPRLAPFAGPKVASSDLGSIVLNCCRKTGRPPVQLPYSLTMRRFLLWLGAFGRGERPRTLIRINAFGSLLFIALTIVFAIAGRGFLWIFLAFAVASGTASILHARRIKRGDA